MLMAGKRVLLAAMLIPGLTGPATAQDRPAAAPSATFIFLKSYDRGLAPGQATRQAYVYLPDGTCRHRRVQASFGWWTGARRERVLPAGRPVTLFMFTNYMNNRMQSLCHLAMTFTPRPGATYRLSLKSSVLSHCQIDIEDIATGQQPDGIAVDRDLRC
jgi:hypothetical protein